MSVRTGNVWAHCVYKAVVYALGRRQAREEAREYESTSEKYGISLRVNTIKPPSLTAILLFDALVTTRL